MAKFLLLFICVLSFITDLKAQQPVYNRQFVYDQKVFDFGTIQEKAGEVRHTFIFTNKGTKPVIISDANASQHYASTQATHGRKGFVHGM